MGINKTIHHFFKRLFLVLNLISGNEHPSSGAMLLPASSSAWTTAYLQLLCTRSVFLNCNHDISASGWADALSLKYTSERAKCDGWLLSLRLVHSAKLFTRHREYWWVVLDVAVSQEKMMTWDTRPRPKNMCAHIFRPKNMYNCSSKSSREICKPGNSFVLFEIYSSLRCK